MVDKHRRYSCQKVRLFQKYIDGIKNRNDTNELLYKLIYEQDNIAKSRKCKLLNITKLGNTNKKDDILRKYSKKFLQKIENFPKNI